MILKTKGIFSQFKRFFCSLGMHEYYSRLSLCTLHVDSVYGVWYKLMSNNSNLSPHISAYKKHVSEMRPCSFNDFVSAIITH